MNFRDELCSIFASIPISCHQQDIEEHLNHLLNKVTEAEIVSECHSNATPLMIACDKGKTNLLNYVVSAYSMASSEHRTKLTSIFGDCLSPLPIDASNQAIHYTDSVEALRCLSLILFYQRSSEYDTQYDSFKSLISQQNDHGDTYVMKLSASGRTEQMKALLGMCSRLRLQYGRKEDDLSIIFNIKNKSGDSAITLAYGSGHLNVLDLLLSSDLSLEISHEDITRLKDILKKSKLMQHLVPLENLEMFNSKQSSVMKCLSSIKAYLQNQSDKVAIALLSEEENNTSRSKGIQRKSKSKSKSRHVEKHEVRISKERLIDVMTARTDLVTDCDAYQTLTKPVFLTLPDGTLVSGRSGKREMENEVPVISILQEQKSLDHLLIERCIPTSDSKSSHDQILSMMRSLCLDPSMLLLNPQEMAMKLSPSQLEAIETILKKQLDAIMQAREIHNRLMK